MSASRSPLGTGDGQRRLALLRRVVEDLSAESNLDRVVETVAELVSEATGADACFVHIVDSERRELTLAGATPPFDSLAGTIRLGIGEGVAGWVAMTGKPAVVRDKWSDPRYLYIPALKGEEFSCLVSVPMMRRNQGAVGVLNAHWREQREVTEAELDTLEDVAKMLAGAVENSLLYKRLAEREAALASFAGRTIEAQEAERRRLAADIHDGVAQRLLSLSYHLDAARAANPEEPEQVSKELDSAMSLLRGALDEVRGAIDGLRPGVLDDLGLDAGIESLARSLVGVNTRVDLEPIALSEHLETALYRIAQEALQNVARHAKASFVSVSLHKAEDKAVLSVADNGVGMAGDPPPHGHYGIVGMKERAELVGGVFEIFSRPGEGTRVVVRVPIPN